MVERLGVVAKVGFGFFAKGLFGRPNQTVGRELVIGHGRRATGEYN
jgi:hypothetical protein